MNDQRTEIFDTIREFYIAHADACVVQSDEATSYYLGTHQVREKDGYRTGFGGVEIKKNYVAAHIMPVYVYPEMLDKISPELKKRMQGKSCFNFKKADAELFGELSELIDAGVARFKEDGKL